MGRSRVFDGIWGCFWMGGVCFCMKKSSTDVLRSKLPLFSYGMEGDQLDSRGS